MTAYLKAYDIRGELHRTDGPALIWANGYQSWWLKGKRMTQEQHAQIVRNQE